MKKRIFIAALAALLPGTFFAQAPSDAMRADFEWFGTLGFRDVQGLPFVRYVAGTSQSAGEASKEFWHEGFLLEETGATFRVLTRNFGGGEYPRSLDPRRVEYRYEPLSLADFARAQLVPDEDAWRRGLHSGPGFTRRAELFILAWVCWRQGLDEVAAQLHSAAQADKSDPRRSGQVEKTPAWWSFRQLLQRDLGHHVMWRTVVDCGEPKPARRALAARFRAIPELYPTCEHNARARALAERYERMAAEDDVHRWLTDAEIAALPPTEQAKEWVFRLRDQNGRQWSQPGSVDLFDRMMGNNATPAHRLLALGDAAVPALIAALGDDGLTRSVGYHRDFYFSHEIITIGSAAWQVIESLAGRQFRESERYRTAQTDAERWQAMRAEIEAWWQERQTVGARGELVKATASGQLNSAQAGAKLLAEYPDAAADALLAGAAASRDGAVREAFMALLGKLDDARVPPFLQREAREGEHLGVRCSAAWLLAKRGDLTGIEALAQVWRESVPTDRMWERLAREKLIGVLAQADSPVGIHALAEGLAQRNAAARQEVLEALHPERRTSLLLRLGDYAGPRRPSPPVSATTGAAIEEMLATALADTATRSRYDHARRLADDAAQLLALRWPERYTFDHAAPFAVRERQRVACANTWRRTRGFGEDPLPPLRPPLPPADVLVIADVVIDPGAKLTPPMRAQLLAVKGRRLDGTLFPDLEKHFLADCAGVQPEQDRGFSIEALREDDTGVTLLVRPEERRGVRSSNSSPRGWRPSWRMQAKSQRSPSGGRLELFPSATSHAHGPALAELETAVTALPPDEKFHFELTLAPDRWSEDTAL